MVRKKQILPSVTVPSSNGVFDDIYFDVPIFVSDRISKSKPNANQTFHPVKQETTGERKPNLALIPNNENQSPNIVIKQEPKKRNSRKQQHHHKETENRNINYIQIIVEPDAHCFYDESLFDHDYAEIGDEKQDNNTKEEMTQFLIKENEKEATETIQKRTNISIKRKEQDVSQISESGQSKVPSHGSNRNNFHPMILRRKKKNNDDKKIKEIKKGDENNNKIEAENVGTKCSLCPAIFLDLNMLTKHQQVIHGLMENPVETRRCPLCFSISFDKNQYLQHLRLHAGEVPHFCPRCPSDPLMMNIDSQSPNPWGFNSFDDWLDHIEQEHHGKNFHLLPQIKLPFVCTHQGGCFKHFDSKEELQDHIKTGHQMVNLKSILKKSSSSKLNHRRVRFEFSSKKLSKPSSSKVGLVPYFVCEREGCGKVLTGYRRLTLHQNLHRRKDKKALINFPCDLCSQAFHCKSLLMAHKRAHSRLFDCPVENCRKSFAKKQSLAQHSKVHQTNEPFNCKVKNCAQKFRSKVELAQHLKNHPSFKKYECEICGECFQQGSQLRKHCQNGHEESQKIQPVELHCQGATSAAENDEYLGCELDDEDFQLDQNYSDEDGEYNLGTFGDVLVPLTLSEEDLEGMELVKCWL